MLTWRSCKAKRGKEGAASSIGSPNKRPDVYLPWSNSHTLKGRNLAITAVESCHQQEAGQVAKKTKGTSCSQKQHSDITARQV